MNDNDIIEELYPHAKYYIDNKSFRGLWIRFYLAYFRPSDFSADGSSISVHLWRRCWKEFIKIARDKTYEEILAYIEDMEGKRRRPTPTSRRVQGLGRE